MSTTSVPIAGRDGGRIELDASHLDALGSDLDGPLLRPEDEAYAQSVSLWNGMITKRPAIVARAESVDDVVRTVRFAADHDIELSIRGGGHNIAGLALCDGGMTLDMSGRNAVEVDPEARLVRVQAGALGRRRHRDLRNERGAGGRVGHRDPRQHRRRGVPHRADRAAAVRDPGPGGRRGARHPGRSARHRPDPSREIGSALVVAAQTAFVDALHFVAAIAAILAAATAVIVAAALWKVPARSEPQSEEGPGPAAIAASD